MEGATATLHCELSKASPVEWRKGPEILRPGDRVSLRQDGVVCELEICDLTVADTGEYSCVCGQEKTSGMLTVKGKDGHMDSLGDLCLCSYLLCPHCSPPLCPVWFLSVTCLLTFLTVQYPGVWVLISTQMTSHGLLPNRDGIPTIFLSPYPS